MISCPPCLVYVYREIITDVVFCQIYDSILQDGKNQDFIVFSNIITIFAPPKVLGENINLRLTIIYAYNSTISSQRTRGYRREE